MGRSGAKFLKGTVGADISSAADSVSALLAAGIAIAGTVALGQVYTIHSVREAEALGINAAYDATNSIRVHRHISEFYRMSEEGIELNMMLYPATATAADIFGVTYAKKLATDCGGRICQLAVAYAPDYSVTPAVYLDGMETIIRGSIPAAQAFADWASDTFKPLHVVLEGRGLNVASSAALNLRGIAISSQVVQYNQVSLMIGQDWTYAETQDANGKKMADVGTLLGALAGREVNENPGEVGAVNVTSTVKLKWLVAGISSHLKVSDIDADLQQWSDKGYIFCWDYQDSAAPGYRFNSDHVCAPIIRDSENNLNESSIALSRTNNRVRRNLRSVYLPKVNSVQRVIKDTGLLPIGTVKYLETFGNTMFGNMESTGLINGGAAKVDPSSDLLPGADQILQVSFNWQPLGTIGQINGVVNIKSQL